MDVQRYLDRIGYSGSALPTLETLQQVHRCHMLTVPFENLTTHSGGKIQLDIPWLFDKIVVQRRGGVCYEINGLFSWLLAQLGYQTTILAARVRSRYTNTYGPPFDHFITMVTLDGHRWLCDVGFGGCFELPLSLETQAPQTQAHWVFRLKCRGDMIFMESSVEAQGEAPEGMKDATTEDGITWRAHYKFTLQPRQREEYREMCVYHQTSPYSLFFCKSICTLLLPRGRITYVGFKLLTTTYPTEEGGPVVKTTQELTAEEIQPILKEKFGIELPSPLIPKDEDIPPPPVRY